MSKTFARLPHTQIQNTSIKLIDEDLILAGS